MFTFAHTVLSVGWCSAHLHPPNRDHEVFFFFLWQTLNSCNCQKEIRGRFQVNGQHWHILKVGNRSELLRASVSVLLFLFWFFFLSCLRVRQEWSRGSTSAALRTDWRVNCSATSLESCIIKSFHDSFDISELNKTNRSSLFPPQMWRY